MSVKQIIPCLDVKNGRVVKGVNFVDIIDAGDPAESARIYCEQGADELVLLDIAATNEGRGTLLEVVRKTAANCSVPFCVGGGVRSVDDARQLLAAGADKVGINSAAVKNPELIQELAEEFGAEKIVIAIDGKSVSPGKWLVYIAGGKQQTELDVVEWAKKVEKLGAGSILLTSIDADGTQSGYDCEMTAAVSEAVSIPVIASGGAGTLDHMVEVLQKGKASAVLAASIFHFGKYTIQEAKDYFIKHGIEVKK